MATKELFSFDTDLIHGEGRYYLVAIPERPLHVDDLPLNIKEMLSHTTASLRALSTAPRHFHGAS
jgi:hypothetical protein